MIQQREQRLRRGSAIHRNAQRRSTRKRCFSTVGCVGCLVFVVYVFGLHTLLNSYRDTVDRTVSNDAGLAAGKDNMLLPKRRDLNSHREGDGVRRTDAKAPLPLNTCDEIAYYIQQQGTSTSDNLMVGGGMLIQPGIPYLGGRVAFEEYVFFQACLPSYNEHHHFHEIQIEVKAFDGDPDIFISATKMKPTTSTSTWLSKKIGGEKIVLHSNLEDFPPGTSTLYIGIYGGGRIWDYRDPPSKNSGGDGNGRKYARFSLSVAVMDRKNPYKNLRIQKGDVAFQKDIARETWKPASAAEEAMVMERTEE